MQQHVRDGLRNGAIAAAVAIGVAWATSGLDGYRRRRRVRTESPLPLPGPGLLGFESEEEDEPEPEGLQYANDEPCQAPPVPWDAPVSSGMPWMLEGDDPGTGCVPPADLEPQQLTEVPFAQGSDAPGWPLSVTKDPKLRVSYKDVRGLFHGRWGRHMGATRTSTDEATGNTYKRVHVGVDLFADDGDVVYATEPGTVITALPYYKGLGALYVLTDSGIIVNYGELRMNSWRSFDIEVGDTVSKGQAIAKVGLSVEPLRKDGTRPAGSHMLHVETYEPDVTVQQIRQGDMRWIKGTAAPQGVLDPTRYLVLARQATLDGSA